MDATIYFPPRSDPYCFRILGQIYHQMGTLHPVEGESCEFVQLYLLDPDAATDEQMQLPTNQGCNPELK